MGNNDCIARGRYVYCDVVNGINVYWKNIVYWLRGVLRKRCDGYEGVSFGWNGHFTSFVSLNMNNASPTAHKLPIWSPRCIDLYSYERVSGDWGGWGQGRMIVGLVNIADCVLRIPVDAPRKGPNSCFVLLHHHLPSPHILCRLYPLLRQVSLHEISRKVGALGIMVSHRLRYSEAITGNTYKCSFA